MMDEENRIITTSFTADDENESSLRPRFMVDYTGQEKIKDNLSVFIEAARLRGDPLDHVPVSYTHLDVYKRQVVQAEHERENAAAEGDEQQ